VVQIGDPARIVGDVPGGSGLVPLARYMFRRTSTTPLLSEGTYTLTAINDRPSPFTQEFPRSDGSRSVYQVLYDSITFADGAFVRRRHADRGFVISAMGDTGLRSSSSFGTGGSYRTRGDSVLIHHYGFQVSGTTTQRFAMEQQQLVRRVALTSGPWVERYTRR